MQYSLQLSLTIRLIFSWRFPSFLGHPVTVALIRHLYSADPASDPVDSRRALASLAAAADDAPAAVVGFPLAPFAPLLPFAGAAFGFGVGAVFPSSERCLYAVQTVCLIRDTQYIARDN